MTWFMIKENNTVSFLPEEKLIAKLANIGVTETTGSSEIIEDNWVLYVGDNNQAILAKEVKEETLSVTEMLPTKLSNAQWNLFISHTFHVSKSYARNMVHMLMTMKKTYTSLNTMQRH